MQEVPYQMKMIHTLEKDLLLSYFNKKHAKFMGKTTYGSVIGVRFVLSYLQ
jgi:hypothetical protein